MFRAKAACTIVLALLALQAASSRAALLPPGNYSLTLADCLGLNTTCTGSISTYDAQSPGTFLSVAGISSFTMNYSSGQVMQATGESGVALDTTGKGFAILPVSGGGLQSYRFTYPIFPLVLDTNDFTVRELILSTQELSNDLFLRYSIKATRNVSSVQEMKIFAGYANYTSSPTLPTLTDALQLSIIADDIRAYLADQSALSLHDNWFSLVNRDELLQTLRNIDAGLIDASSVSFDLDGTFGVPEPRSIFLLSLGLFGLAFAMRRRAS